MPAIVSLGKFERMTFHCRLITQSVLAVALSLPIANLCSAQATAPSAPRASISSYGPELQRLEQQADWAGLEKLSRQALQTLERRLGPDTVDVAAAADWLATALKGQSRYGEAETLERRALAIDERVLGPDHPNTNSVLLNLGELIQSLGRPAEAEPLLSRALAGDRKHFGPDHPQTATDEEALAVLLRYQQRYAEAEPLFRHAITVAEESLAPEHPDLAPVSTACDVAEQEVRWLHIAVQ